MALDTVTWFILLRLDPSSFSSSESSVIEIVYCALRFYSLVDLSVFSNCIEFSTEMKALFSQFCVQFACLRHFVALLFIRTGAAAPADSMWRGSCVPKRFF